MYLKGKNYYIKFDYIYIALVGMLYFLWACHLKQSWAPDESMRDDVAYWIANHHQLPIGNEEELRNPSWGFSYAFTPYLTSVIGSLFIRIAWRLSEDPSSYLIALRMVSVLSGMGVAFFSLKIGKRIFRNRMSDYLFASMICCLPQFVFLCAYFNCDSFAILTTMIIMYSCISGLQDGWNYRNAIGLGIGMGLCALSYYNAYGFILCSMILFVGSNIRENKRTLYKYGIIILGSAFLVAGWYFIRNIIIYNGDMLGMSTSRMYSELYAVDGLKPSQRGTYYNVGLSLWSMLNDKVWIKLVLWSFIGVFGYMNNPIPIGILIIYYIFIMVGIIIGIVFLIKDKKNSFAWICAIGTVVIPVALSIYYSYMNDYQPQGRYCMSALPVLALTATVGYDKITARYRERVQKIILGILLGIWFCLLIIVAVQTIFPHSWISVHYNILG